MQKLNYLNKIVASGLVVVIRADTADQACRIAEACAEGGVTAMEVTFTFAALAVEAITELAKRYQSGEILGGRRNGARSGNHARHALAGGCAIHCQPVLVNADVARMCYG